MIRKKQGADVTRFWLIVFIAVALGLQGCASYSVQTSAASISKKHASRVIDGQSTRTDIIALFGRPNGMVSGIPNGMVSLGSQNALQSLNSLDESPSNDILHYKDCVLTSTGKAGLLSGSLVIPRGYSIEACKVFTALLDEKDIVIAHAYLDNNIITKEKMATLKEGDSNKKVIQVLGGPSEVIPNNNGNKIYLYKNCLGKSSLSMWNPFNTDIKNRQSCQQATLLISEKGIVERVTFIPWDDSPI